jgi:histidinol-phosphate aminotransferase
MPITRRNLLQGIAAGTAVAAGARPVAAFVAGALPKPLPNPLVPGPTLLNRNENAYGPSQKVLAVIREAASVSCRYPRGEYDVLRNMLADLHKVKPEQIVLGVGSSEIIRMAGAACLGPSKKLLVANPTYPSLGNYAEASGVPVVKIPLTRTSEHDTDAMLAKANSATGLVCLCNPNNPTGTLTPRKNLESFVSKLPAEVMILVDEAYHHYVSATAAYRSFLDFPLGDPRIIVTRTFSKIYGLAGLRIGYSVSSREVAARLSALRLQNGVTILSVKAALEDSAYVRMAAKRNSDDRQEFMNQVNARMLRAIDSHANSCYSILSAPSAKSFRISKKTTFSSLRQFPPWTSTSTSPSVLPPKCMNFGAFGTSCPPAKWPCSAAALLWLRGEPRHR